MTDAGVVQDRVYKGEVNEWWMRPDGLGWYVSFPTLCVMWPTASSSWATGCSPRRRRSEPRRKQR